MARLRTAIVGACVVLATLTPGACKQANEQVNGRTLACGEAPEDACVRMADDISAGYERRNPDRGPIVSVTVTPRDCGGVVPLARRCWLVEATPGGGGVSSRVYFQLADGTFVEPP